MRDLHPLFWLFISFLGLSFARGSVLVLHFDPRFGRSSGGDNISMLSCEATLANWNIQLDDAGHGEFGGRLHFDVADPGGCHRVEGFFPRGHLALLDAEELERCGKSFAEVTSAAAKAGAIGVVFFAPSDHPGPLGMPLGDHQPPTIRSVMIARHHGEAARDVLLAAGADDSGVSAELRQGLLISEDGYEEQFIFRVDEIASTRPTNFMWHTYPGILPSDHSREPLSAKLIAKGVKPPIGWFTTEQSAVPLFNPSLLGLVDGSLLATVRMSNGPGCPSVRRSKESSMDTRIFRNELVLAHIDAVSFEVVSHVLVEMKPQLVCRFDENTKIDGRRFLDEVHGPMDVRIVRSVEGKPWISFYAERNVPSSDEVARGMHVAPLHIEWSPCHDTATIVGVSWRLIGVDAILTSEDCSFVRMATIASKDLSACQEKCDQISVLCNAVSFRAVGGACVLRQCLSASANVGVEVRHGWQASRRIDMKHERRVDDVSQKPKDEQAGLCLRRAWVETGELISFPTVNGVEKNWNLIMVSQQRIVIEYFLEPHIVLEARLEKRPDGSSILTSFEETSVSRWPFAVLHGVTSVRGGFCCLPLPESLWRNAPFAAEDSGDRLSGTLLLGAGHLQRIRSPFDTANGDVDRFRRQAKSRTYHNFLYLLRGEHPYDVVAVSTEWCIAMTGLFSRSWRPKLASREEACEAIQFASGLALRQGEELELIIGYGINDCEASLLPLQLGVALGLLRRSVSALNISLECMEL